MEQAFIRWSHSHGPVAQQDRAAPPKGQVAGSNPAGAANYTILMTVLSIDSI